MGARGALVLGLAAHEHSTGGDELLFRDDGLPRSRYACLQLDLGHVVLPFGLHGWKECCVVRVDEDAADRGHAPARPLAGAQTVVIQVPGDLGELGTVPCHEELVEDAADDPGLVLVDPEPRACGITVSGAHPSVAIRRVPGGRMPLLPTLDRIALCSRSLHSDLTL